jgi:ribokinase
MAIWNLGSINADFVYSLPHLPAPGETLASTSRQVFLGGKGANMSVAAARAAAETHHVGAVGQDGRWTVERLMEYGVDTRWIAEVDLETAQAIIMVDVSGENSIILHPGANRAIPENMLQSALAEANTGDWFVCQNETNLQLTGVKLAKELGMKVAYAAAPFDASAITDVLPHLDLLILNDVEMAQLKDASGKDAAELGVETVIVTNGADGSTLFNQTGEQRIPAISVEPVDTTGAGDTFTGYVLAGLDRGMPIQQSMIQATRAAALMVLRYGTADVIPDLSEVLAFRP